MSQTVIKVENLSKQYQLGQVGTGTIRRDLQRWYSRIRGKEDPNLKIGHENVLSVHREMHNAKREIDFVWALRDINFEVKQGDVLGIIGKNGAGKSTLLKILSQVTSPTTGQVKIKGRIASLLEVGTGFHPELTGRENIFLNGAILGMTKSEIRSKFDEIVDFSGIENYIDTPVKRYSSGMYVRLAFAVAAHLEPEILVVDEVLAVGDAEFQKKALGKMQDVSTKDGRTVLFVSHNMNAIKRLCNNGLLLKNGNIEYSGIINETIRNYLKVFQSENLVCQVKYDSSDKIIQILEAKLTNNKGKILTHGINVNDEFFLNIIYSFKNDISKVHLTFIISNDSGERIFFCDRVDYHGEYAKVEKGIYESNLKIPNPLLLPGKYTITLGCACVELPVNDHKFDIMSFEISNEDSFRSSKRDGYVFQPIRWELIKTK